MTEVLRDDAADGFLVKFELDASFFAQGPRKVIDFRLHYRDSQVYRAEFENGKLLRTYPVEARSGEGFLPASCFQEARLLLPGHSAALLEHKQFLIRTSCLRPSQEPSHHVASIMLA